MQKNDLSLSNVILFKLLKGVKSTMDIKKILKYALEVEARGQSFYSVNASLMKNVSSKKIFQELSEMEAEHQRYIREYASTCGIEIEELEGNTHYHFERRYEELSPKESHASDLGDIAALRLAYLIEHDISEFYKKIGEKIEDKNTKKLLLELSEWEEEHERMITEQYNEIKERAWGDVGFFPF